MGPILRIIFPYPFKASVFRWHFRVSNAKQDQIREKFLPINILEKKTRRILTATMETIFVGRTMEDKILFAATLSPQKGRFIVIIQWKVCYTFSPLCHLSDIPIDRIKRELIVSSVCLGIKPFSHAKILEILQVTLRKCLPLCEGSNLKGFTLRTQVVVAERGREGKKNLSSKDFCSANLFMMQRSLLQLQ